MKTLDNDEFFLHMRRATGARSYLEVFGGYGRRTIRPLSGLCSISTSEIDTERRLVLREQYPDIGIWCDFREIDGRWDLVSCDGPIGIPASDGFVLSLRVLAPKLKKWARRGIVTYMPLDVRAYVERCCGDAGNADLYEQDIRDMFGTLDTSAEMLAEYFGGRLECVRRGRPDLIYCGIVL